MTQSVPPDPQNRNERQDEFIAVVLALATAGGVLFWGMTRGGDRSMIAGLSADSNGTPAALADPESDLVRPRTSIAGRTEAMDAAETGTDESESIGDGLSALFGQVFLGGGPLGQTDDDDETDETTRQTRSASRDAEVEQLTRAIGVSPDSISSSDDTDPEASEEETATESDPADTTAATSDESTEESDDLPPPTDFTDIGADFWAKSYIDQMSRLGIVEGFPSGEFRPETDVTRAEFASSLRRAFADPDNAGLSEYTDITADFWAKDAIDQATQLNFMSGYPDESFRPASPVTRLEVVISLATGLDLEIPDNPDAVLETYGDRDQIPDWAVDKIAAATAAGLVVNHPDVNRFEPNVPATRAEATSMIYLALANQKDLPDIPSYYRVTP